LSPGSPGPATSSTPNRARLAQVKNWVYILDVNSIKDSAKMKELEASSYRLVVLDFVPSESSDSSRAFDMKGLVMRLHNSGKLVVAYVDIGEAENFRTYWQSGWKIGHPPWIVGGDPDGFSGNYPVAYWTPEYQAIWTGRQGYLQRIMKDASMDGVYLDWVEAYSDTNVVDAAQRAHIDPRSAMITWVQRIAAFVRDINSNAIVIGQNAAKLAAFQTYRDTIDAIAQEQIWFEGGPNNNPPGDCPLPATDTDIDTPRYVNSLSPPCRALYQQFASGTLHTSSQSHLDDLALATTHGLPVFTVDYAAQQMNIDAAFRQSRGHGFVPFTSDRILDLVPAPR
jgi:cysteinyl-tRNA synthetase